jgi:hypothetical protein
MSKPKMFKRLSATSNEWREWRSFTRRVKNPKSSQFGVEVYEPWLTFTQFEKDNPAPCHVWNREGLTFERIDTTQGYVPGNVQWVVSTEVQELLDYNARTTAKNRAAGFE